jgi:V/A-type H+-transporting ATPase subunit C
LSENKITDKDYVYLSAMLRAKEPYMLNRERVERMLEAPSVNEAAIILMECGYEDMTDMKAGEIEAGLAKQKEKLFAEVERIAPEKAVVEVFRLKYDYHNAKTLVKAQGAKLDGRRLLADSGRVKPNVLIDAFNTGNYKFIPTELGKAMAEAQGTLARTGNPQLSDFILDRAYFTELLILAESISDNSFFLQYAKLAVDSANLRAAVRITRMGRDIDYMRTVLIPGGNVSKERVAEAAGMGDGLPSVFAASPLSEAAQMSVAVLSGGPLTAFELACDDAVTRFLKRAKLSSFGVEPVIAYLAAVETEITAARMILTGRLAGITPDVIRERLRETYA